MRLNQVSRSRATGERAGARDGGGEVGGGGGGMRGGSRRSTGEETREEQLPRATESRSTLRHATARLETASSIPKAPMQLFPARDLSCPQLFSPLLFPHEREPRPSSGARMNLPVSWFAAQGISNYSSFSLTYNSSRDAIVLLRSDLLFHTDVCTVVYCERAYL